MTNIEHYNKKNKKNIIYPIINSVTNPIKHSDDPDIPIPLSFYVLKSLENSDKNDQMSCSPIREPESDFQNDIPSSDLRGSFYDVIRLISKKRITDLVRKLILPKYKSERLVSELKFCNVVEDDVYVKMFESRGNEFHDFYSVEDGITYCNDIKGLFSKLNVVYRADDWRFFFDGSNKSVKGVLLHNGNQLPPLPILYSKNLKENRETVEKCISKIKYNAHKWLICCDFKVIGLLLGKFFIF